MTSSNPTPPRAARARHEAGRIGLILVPFAGIAVLGYVGGLADQLGSLGAVVVVGLVLLVATRVLFGWPRLPKQQPRPATVTATTSDRDELVSSGTATK